MPSGTLVWVVEIHAKAVNWNHRVSAGYAPPAQPHTDYSVVMDARTGQVSDSGECMCWPLLLGLADPGHQAARPLLSPLAPRLLTFVPGGGVELTAELEIIAVEDYRLKHLVPGALKRRGDRGRRGRRADPDLAEEACGEAVERIVPAVVTCLASR